MRSATNMRRAGSPAPARGLRIEDLLGTIDSSARSRLLRELLLVEWELVASKGSQPQVSDYLLSAEPPPPFWAEFMKETFLTWASAGKIAWVDFGEL